jgi:exodeoxyribonuclease VII large subunit
MLAVPVYSAVGHERDVTLIDDVAAVRCSTPTHAAEAVVGIDCVRARQEIVANAARIARSPSAAVRDRAGVLVAMAGAPSRAVARERRELNQKAREVRASSERGIEGRHAALLGALERGLGPAVGRTLGTVSDGVSSAARRAEGAALSSGSAVARGREYCRVSAVSLRAHDPQRTLERGFARVEDAGGGPVTSVPAAESAGQVNILFADGGVGATVGGPGGGGAARKKKAQRSAPGEPAGGGADSDPDFEQIRLEGVEGDE